jgi:hypothetical protein
MYRLEIMGPVGRRVIEWDPEKLEQQDPNTLMTVAEADRLFKEVVASTTSKESASRVPKMAVLGRWLA